MGSSQDMAGLLLYYITMNPIFPKGFLPIMLHTAYVEHPLSFYIWLQNLKPFWNHNFVRLSLCYMPSPQVVQPVLQLDFRPKTQKRPCFTDIRAAPPYFAFSLWSMNGWEITPRYFFQHLDKLIDASLAPTSYLEKSRVPSLEYRV